MSSADGRLPAARPLPALLGALAAALVVSGCDRREPPGGATTAGDTSAPADPAATVKQTGIAACDALLATLDACVARAPAESRAALAESRRLYARQALGAKTDAARRTVSIGCQAEFDALGDEPGCR